jgi:outer membrane receptor for ferrienterochelin and colicin
MFQNQWEYGTSASWVKGKHILSVGTTWDHIQLNILNNNTDTDTLDFTTFENFVEGNLHGGDEFVGSANRYYASDTVGTYVNDNFKATKKLTITAGLRWGHRRAALGRKRQAHRFLTLPDTVTSNAPSMEFRRTRL